MSGSIVRTKCGMHGLIGRAGVCLALIWACGCASHPVKVHQYGQMHEVLGGGGAAAHARIGLATAMERPHAYGVGALEGLKGEITIDDGRAWLAHLSGDALRVEGPLAAPEGGAALLTIAYVELWDEIPIDGDMTQETLEDFIHSCAKDRSLDASKPFPFILEGRLTDCQMHVVNGACPMRPGVRLTSDMQPWRHQIDRPSSARIIGFYAADSVGDLTHPGTAVHAHAIMTVNGRTVTGHVERMAVAPGSILRLPSRK